MVVRFSISDEEGTYDLNSWLVEDYKGYLHANHVPNMDLRSMIANKLISHNTSWY